jgi:hypothetical protein
MMTDKCGDTACSRRLLCRRYAEGTIGSIFKEWRGCECNYFLQFDEDKPAQEIRDLMREVVNDERKDL